MDKADIANDYIEWRLDQVLEARKRNPPSALMSRAICKQCDEPIPAARRKALPGVQLCIECQLLMEAR